MSKSHDCGRIGLEMVYLTKLRGSALTILFLMKVLLQHLACTSSLENVGHYRAKDRIIDLLQPQNDYAWGLASHSAHTGTVAGHRAIVLRLERSVSLCSNPRMQAHTSHNATRWFAKAAFPPTSSEVNSSSSAPLCDPLDYFPRSKLHS